MQDFKVITVTSVDREEFTENVSKYIFGLLRKGFTPDVKYSTVLNHRNNVEYSALILGLKDDSHKKKI